METNIDYIYNTTFVLENETKVSKWLTRAVKKEGFSVGEVVYAFFNDDDLKALNSRHLNHDYFTDVISFNDSKGTVLNGNIAISIDRVRENAERYKTSFNNELLRVMVHGLLHFMGYNDSSEKETQQMRDKEDDNLKTFHVEQ
ncbi:rRNA maturation RNase YbeY [Flavobacteriaceae bacterium]|nr:rRNA maturation RNase YbeY [Flavobacteriaceae bacterium]MDB4097276.1 rRNA maturation RNase YbeY [Flavobacteriaceae bacterium]